VILAPAGGRVEIEHLFTAYDDGQAKEIGIDRHGALDVRDEASLRRLCEAVLSGSVSLDGLEAVLLETAVDKAHGNLSSAARMLGMTRPTLAYRLKRLHEAEGAAAAAENSPSPEDPPSAPGEPAAGPPHRIPA
jgi:DNA-binding NtrC family response regulator